MNARMIKMILGWNVVLTFLLLAAVAANANLAQAANDPPVKMFSASNDLVGGALGTGSDLIIDGTFPTELAYIEVALPEDKPHLCIAFATAEVEHQSGNGVYEFGIGKGASTHIPSFRRIEMINNEGIQDPKYKEVSTTTAWGNLTGDIRIFFNGRKDHASASDTKVTKASLSVICVKKVLNK